MKRENINLEDCYYHGLAGGIPFWDAERVKAIGLQQLRQIISSKGIYSRRILQNKYGLKYDDKEPKYNGDAYISVCIKNAEDNEFWGENYCLDSAYFRYVRNKISIALNPDIINKCEFRQGEYRKLPGERQVLDNIDISNFRAIVIGMPVSPRLISEVAKILSGTGIPITDIDGNELTNTIKREVENIER